MLRKYKSYLQYAFKFPFSGGSKLWEIRVIRKICQNIVWRANNQHFLKVLSTTAQNVTVADNTQFLASDGNVPNVSATIYAVFGKYLLDVNRSSWSKLFLLQNFMSIDGKTLVLFFLSPPLVAGSLEASKIDYFKN